MSDDILKEQLIKEINEHWDELYSTIDKMVGKYNLLMREIRKKNDREKDIDARDWKREDIVRILTHDHRVQTDR